MTGPIRATCRRAAAAVAFTALPAVAFAQIPCLLQTPACPAIAACQPPTPGACSAPLAMQHTSASPCAGGSFDLIGTQYETACHGGVVGTCPNPGVFPPVRHWATGNGFDFVQANSGCPDFVAQQWIINPGYDFSTGTNLGHWIAYQADWAAPGVNGCALHPTRGPATHTVSEISDVVPASEGTPDHASWYLITGAPEAGGSYNLDGPTGATGTCSPLAIPEAPVAGLTITSGRVGAPRSGAACRANPDPLVQCSENAVDPNFFDVTLTLDDPDPLWYTEAGPKGAPTLIAGYQIVYAAGPGEPTSSSYAAGGWQAGRNPLNPLQGAAPAPLAPGTVTISIPKGAMGTSYWLATRLVYSDPINASAAFDPAATAPGQGIFLASDVSQHCGPVTFDICMAVEFTGVTARRTAAGVLVGWTTARPDGTTGFAVHRAASDRRRPESDPEVAWVDFTPGRAEYEALDGSVAADRATPYYYYVLEYTGDGAGSLSPAVRVAGEGGSQPQRGGRAASRRVRGGRHTAR